MKMNFKSKVTLPLMLLLISVGCSNDPFALVQVTGTVKFEDGSPVLNSTYKIRFSPQVESLDGITFPRMGVVEVDSEGNFISATTSRYKDGLTKGENIVFFDLGKGGDGKPIVPFEYTRVKTSPIRIDLSETRHVEIVIPRP